MHRDCVERPCGGGIVYCNMLYITIYVLQTLLLLVLGLVLDDRRGKLKHFQV